MARYASTGIAPARVSTHPSPTPFNLPAVNFVLHECVFMLMSPKGRKDEAYTLIHRQHGCTRIVPDVPAPHHGRLAAVKVRDWAKVAALLAILAAKVVVREDYVVAVIGLAGPSAGIKTVGAVGIEQVVVDSVVGDVAEIRQEANGRCAAGQRAVIAFDGIVLYDYVGAVAAVNAVFVRLGIATKAVDVGILDDHIAVYCRAVPGIIDVYTQEREVRVRDCKRSVGVIGRLAAAVDGGIADDEAGLLTCSPISGVDLSGNEAAGNMHVTCPYRQATQKLAGIVRVRNGDGGGTAMECHAVWYAGGRGIREGWCTGCPTTRC